MWLVSGALLVAFASYVALPIGLAWYLPQLAARHGVQLHVERARVDPFTSTVRFHGVGVAASGQSSIRWSSVAARVDLAALLSGRLVLDDFRLSEAKLHVGEPVSGAPGALSRISAALPGDARIGELVIDGVELETISEAAGHAVAIDWLRVASLDEALRPEGAEVELHLSVGDGRVRLHGRLNIDTSGWILGGEASANGVPLDGLPSPQGAGGSWRGRLGGAGPVRIVYSPDSGMFSATTRGRWAVDGPGLGPGSGPAQISLSGARADWSGTAFLTFSQDAVERLSVDGEVGLRKPRIEIAGVLDLEATELMLRVDASRTPEPRVTVDGRIPALRLDGKGGAFEAVGAEAANLVSRIVLRFADVVEADIEELTVDSLDVRLPDGRLVDMERIAVERGSFASDTDIVSAAAGTVERVDWRGLAGPGRSGTAGRLAVEQAERPGSGSFGAALASAGVVGDGSGDSDVRLRDVALESVVISSTGAFSAGGARISDARLADTASTLVLETVDLNGVERDGSGATKVESARAGVVDHTRAGMWAVTGTGLELAGGTLSDGAGSDVAWTARSIRLEAMDVGTADASWTLRGLALDDAAGAHDHAGARFAGSEALELGFGGHRVFVERLSVDAPVWREGTVDARAVGAAATTIDTVRRHRWHSDGWRLTDVERTASGRASADTASLETLVLTVSGDSTTGARSIELDGLSFDGESAVRAAGAVAERTYHRAGDGTGIDVAGLDARGVEWNGETLAAARGAAPLMSVMATPHRASFDGVAFASARVGAGSAHEFATLRSEAVRGRVEPALEWSAEAVTLDGYRASASGGTTVESVEARRFALAGEANDARVHAGRAAARGVRIEPSGDTAFADAVVEDVSVHDASGGGSGSGSTSARATQARPERGPGAEPLLASARAMRARPLTIRESGLEIGTLSLSRIESAIAVNESGDWEIPALPIGTGDDPSSFSVRVLEAGTTDSDSVVRITDRTTTPAFAERFFIDRATLRGFDSAARGVPARLSIEATAGIFTSLHADGALVPTLTGIDLDLAATIRGLSLRALSPYARLHLGRAVERGRADVAVDATLRTSDLAGVADFSLGDIVLGGSGLPAASGLPVESGSPSGSPESTREGTVALGAALERLAGEQGTIELRVPFHGRLDAPGFDFDGLVAAALARAILAAAAPPPGGE